MRLGTWGLCHGCAEPALLDPSPHQVSSHRRVPQQPESLGLYLLCLI